MMGVFGCHTCKRQDNTR